MICFSHWLINFRQQKEAAAKNLKIAAASLKIILLCILEVKDFCEINFRIDIESDKCFGIVDALNIMSHF